jgi:hypothetical protein
VEEYYTNFASLWMNRPMVEMEMSKKQKFKTGVEVVWDTWVWLFMDQ